MYLYLKGKPMKKTLSLITLSLLATQPAFSSASDQNPALFLDEMEAYVPVATPLSDPELEKDDTPPFLRAPVTSGPFAQGSSSRWMPSLSAIPEGAPTNNYDALRPSVKVEEGLDNAYKIRFKRRPENEVRRLPTIVEVDEDEERFEEEALRIALSAGVKEADESQTLRSDSGSQTFVIPKRRTIERRTRRSKENQ